MKLEIDKVQENLKTKKFGKKILFLHETGSTNDLAKEFADYGASEGTIVITETQTAGRGRVGRKWFSPKDGLYFSLILRPKLEAKEAIKLVFVASLAVAEVLHENYGLRVETKWPNDVLVSGRKVCGILCEMKTKGENVNYVVIGVGVNANVNVKEEFPEDLKTVATSLKDELRRKVRLEELLRLLLEKLENVYEQFMKEGFPQILNAWKKYASFVGKNVEVIDEAKKWCGLALDVDKDGALVIRLGDGTVKRFIVGDVSLKIKK
ncbi:MAG: biotin--[acetyl-CoA-carboxylase] ligase [Candidatus Bathyarchaeota archaeon]|nr:MAG: biotin--[acetyl-CoA-carboxylase] ligase [Candidatus Bathyarchaeota archaeon]